MANSREKSDHERMLAETDLDRLEIEGAPKHFMLMIWSMMQVFDDIHDGDEVDQKEFDVVLWSSMVWMPNNPFFIQYRDHLTSVVSLAILKWRGANYAEENGLADERSYGWRGSYYDILLKVYELVHGTQKAEQDAYKIMQTMGETFKSYREEFPKVKAVKNETNNA